MSDLISRQAAINAVKSKWYVYENKHLNDYEQGWNDACDCIEEDVLESLPSAEPCDKDVISREGLLKSWEELSPRGRTEFDQVIMASPALPSADRPQGEWIDKGDYAECPNCGADSGTQFDGVQPIPRKSNFCPNCGAYMKGENK